MIKGLRNNIKNNDIKNRKIKGKITLNINDSNQTLLLTY